MDTRERPRRRRNSDPTPEQMTLGGEELTLGRSLRAPGWYVPRVEMRELRVLELHPQISKEREILGRPQWVPSEPQPCLVWRFWDRGPVAKVRPTTEAVGALDEFLKLRDATDKAVFSYAKRWGVLGLCRHNCPFTHNNRLPIEKPFVGFGLKPPCLPRMLCDAEGKPVPGVYYEPVAAWRNYVAKADALIKTTAKLVAEKPLSRITPKERDVVAKQRGSNWALVIKHAQGWLVDSGVSWSVFDFPSKGEAATKMPMRVASNPRRLYLVAECPMLFDVLALQLAQAVTRNEGLFLCASCKQPFFRERKPRSGQLAFCHNCGRRASMRLLMRRRREKEKRP